MGSFDRGRTLGAEAIRSTIYQQAERSRQERMLSELKMKQQVQDRLLKVKQDSQVAMGGILKELSELNQIPGGAPNDAYIRLQMKAQAAGLTTEDAETLNKTFRLDAERSARITQGFESKRRQENEQRYRAAFSTVLPKRDDGNTDHQAIEQALQYETTAVKMREAGDWGQMQYDPKTNVPQLETLDIWAQQQAEPNNYSSYSVQLRDLRRQEQTALTERERTRAKERADALDKWMGVEFDGHTTMEEIMNPNTPPAPEPGGGGGAQPLPMSKDDLQAGQLYTTPKGTLEWDGSKFVEPDAAPVSEPAPTPVSEPAPTPAPSSTPAASSGSKAKAGATQFTGNKATQVGTTAGGSPIMVSPLRMPDLSGISVEGMHNTGNRIADWLHDKISPKTPKPYGATPLRPGLPNPKTLL